MKTTTMPTRVTFHFPCHLIWFSLDLKGSFREENLEEDCSILVDKVVQVPYTPRNLHDFTAEFRLEHNGFYARVYESKGKSISFEPPLDSLPGAVTVGNMNSTMNTGSMVADLSVALPGELLDPEEMMTDEEILASDPEFGAWLDNRQEEALAHQMAAEDDLCF